MHTKPGIVICLIAATAASPASAAAIHHFAIPAGSLDRALMAAGEQGQSNIGFGDGRLARLSTPGVSGKMTTAQALDRLLVGSDFLATEIRPGTFHIDHKRFVIPPRPTPRPIDPAPVQNDDIVVTSSKRATGLSHFAGSALVVPLDGAGGVPGGVNVLGDLGSRLPIVQTTALGPGRNKLFLRGIADSSFAGPTQSTIGSYFGDTRLLYNGPDPNLRLYDVDRVEVLMGPQGTLYGAGAIAGIVRIAPNLPTSDGPQASVQAGLAATGKGGIGHDVGGMINLPITDRLAVRAVGYQAYEAGYIDDIERGQNDINGVLVYGGRFAIRARPFSDWVVDLGAIVQSTRARDLQYATRGGPADTRGSAVAQPFDDDFYSGYGTISYDGGAGVHALLTLSVTNRDTSGRYDATLPGLVPSAYEYAGENRLFSAEARLWRSLPSGVNWLVGVSGIVNHDAENRSLGPLDMPRDLIGVDNRTKDAALFGEATVPLPLKFVVTAGGRLTYARTDGRPLDVGGTPTFYRGMGHTRFDPSIGFVRPFGPSLNWFGRYGVGFRTGGLAVTPRIGRTAAYDADRINVFETGLRFGDQGRRGLSGHASISYARWRNIQADLVGPNGFPFTANVGNGRISGFESAVDWRLSDNVGIGGAVFLNRSKLFDAAPAFVRAQGDPLPDTPRFSANGHIVWRPMGVAQDGPQFEIASHYVGHSVLGVGPRLSLRQGGYSEVDFASLLPLRFASISFRIDNVADHRGNRFALGNPLLLGREDQYTPLRPRTFRIGFTTRIGRKDGHTAVGPDL